jgi:hypothetical protein
VLTSHGTDTVDIEAIKTVMGQYFWLMDMKRWADLRDVFTDDMVMAAPDDVAGAAPVVGRDRVVKVISAVLGPAITVHQGYVLELDFVDADRARGVWGMSDTVAYPDDPARSFRGSGYYLGEYVRTTHRWKISALTLRRRELDRG